MFENKKDLTQSFEMLYDLDLDVLKDQDKIQVGQTLIAYQRDGKKIIFDCTKGEQQTRLYIRTNKKRNRPDYMRKLGFNSFYVVFPLYILNHTYVCSYNLAMPWSILPVLKPSRDEVDALSMASSAVCQLVINESAKIQEELDDFFDLRTREV